MRAPRYARPIGQLQRIAAYLTQRRERIAARKLLEIEMAWEQHLTSSVVFRQRDARLQLERLWETQNGRCFYCDVETWLKTDDALVSRMKLGTRATREHLIRRADGGTDDDENIVIACHDCNTMRGDALVDEWKLLRKEDKV